MPQSKDRLAGNGEFEMRVDAVLNMEPRRLAKLSAKRLARAQRRATAKIQNAEELLAIARKSGVTARSWQAAILARVIAEEKARKG